MKIKNRFGEKYISSDGFPYIIKEYKDSRNVEIIFEDGTIKNTNYFNISHNHITKNKSNNHTSSRNIKAKATFIERVNEKNPDIEILGEYTTSSQRILVKCKKCGYEWKAFPHNILKGHGCQKCKYSNLLLTEDKFKEKVMIVNPGISFKTPYQGRKEKITAIYPCGHEYTCLAVHFLNTKDCPICKKQGKYVDAEGNSFSTIKEMCKANGISTTSYYNKKNKGIVGTDCLKKLDNCGRHKGRPKKSYLDHLGNKYNSLKEMCDAYNINESTYWRRIKKGYSVKDALTKPKRIYNTSLSQTIRLKIKKYNKLRAKVDNLQLEINKYLNDEFKICVDTEYFDIQQIKSIIDFKKDYYYKNGETPDDNVINKHFA